MFFISNPIYILLVYSKGIDFCIHTLYPITLPLLVAEGFFVDSSGFFYIDDSVIYRQRQSYYYLPIWYTFISFSCLIAVASTMLKSSDKR